MAGLTSADLGTKPIWKLLMQQALPASVGILVMSLNIVVDTIFVGNWIGSTAIAAINVVLPVSFFIAALGMAIGIGGASIISRALGEGKRKRARKTFGNQLSLTILLTITLVVLGLYYVDVLIPAFGGKGEIFAPAKIYYIIVLYGVPLLALCMMGNSVIRAEGKPTFAMVAMIIPSIGNLLLDYLLIYRWGMGMTGAALATTISYFLCFLYVGWFFFSRNSELRITWTDLLLSGGILREITALGFVTLSRQAVVSLIYLLMNNILFDLGGADAVAVYAIIGRMLMFALFPVLGVTQGFIPIAGYNYGAKNFLRVKSSIYTAVGYASGLGLLVLCGIYFFAEGIVRIFTDNAGIVQQTPSAMKIVFAATPIVALQLIGAAYFQAVGKAVPALLLTLSRQGFFFIPLILILPLYFGETGVWLAFPIADVLSTLVTGYFLNREIKRKLPPVFRIV